MDMDFWSMHGALLVIGTILCLLKQAIELQSVQW